MEHRVYTILIESPEKPGGNFSAYCPDVPGCIAAGDTEEETVSEMISALAFHLEGLAEDGEPAPARTMRAVEVAVRLPEPHPKAQAS